MSEISAGRVSIKPSTGSFESRHWSTHPGQAGETVALQPGPVQTFDIQPAKTGDDDDDFVTIACPSGLFLTLPTGSEQVATTDDASGDNSWWLITEDPTSTLQNTFAIRNVGRDCYVAPQSTSPGSLVISSTATYPWSIAKSKR